MAETIGLIASVIQVAGAGLKLSQTLYQYADGVATADRRIKDIAKEIQLTSFVIEELGDVFKHDETSALMSKNAVKTANETMKECSSVFAEIDATLKKSKKNTLGRLMLPFRDTKIELLRNHIDKLKSTLQLLMQVLTHVHQVAAKKLDREAETKQKAQIQELIELKKKSAKKYEESLKNFSIDGDTLSGDEAVYSDKENDDPVPCSSLALAALAIGSTINPKTLETCVEHIRSLLEDIETLQQAITKQVDGDDHSEHHQSLIGSYFRARGHLDSVLFGSSQKPGATMATYQDASLLIHANSTEVEIGMQKTVTGSTLQNTMSRQETLTEVDFKQAVLEATEKARVEEKEKLRQEVEALRVERETLQLEAEKTTLEFGRKMKESVDKSAATSIPAVRQLPIKFQDTLGRKYTLPFLACKTWDGMHNRIKRVYAPIDEWSGHAVAGHFDLLDKDGNIVMPEDWDDEFQPGMSLTMQFWPSCRPAATSTPIMRMSHRSTTTTSSHEDLRDSERRITQAAKDTAIIAISNVTNKSPESDAWDCLSPVQTSSAEKVSPDTRSDDLSDEQRLVAQREGRENVKELEDRLRRMMHQRPVQFGFQGNQVSAMSDPDEQKKTPRKAKLAKTIMEKTPAQTIEQNATGEKRVGRRRGPLQPEQRQQAREIRKLRRPTPSYTRDTHAPDGLHPLGYPDLADSPASTHASSAAPGNVSIEPHSVEIPVNIVAAITHTDEERKRNAGATVKLRAMRMEEKRETEARNAQLEQQLREVIKGFDVPLAGAVPSNKSEARSLDAEKDDIDKKRERFHSLVVSKKKLGPGAGTHSTQLKQRLHGVEEGLDVPLINSEIPPQKGATSLELQKDDNVLQHARDFAHAQKAEDEISEDITEHVGFYDDSETESNGVQGIGKAGVELKDASACLTASGRSNYGPRRLPAPVIIQQDSERSKYSARYASLPPVSAKPHDTETESSEEEDEWYSEFRRARNVDRREAHACRAIPRNRRRPILTHRSWTDNDIYGTTGENPRFLARDPRDAGIRRHCVVPASEGYGMSPRSSTAYLSPQTATALITQSKMRTPQEVMQQRKLRAEPNEDWSKSLDLAECGHMQNRVTQRNSRKSFKSRVEDLEPHATPSGETTKIEGKKTSDESGYHGEDTVAKHIARTIIIPPPQPHPNVSEPTFLPPSPPPHPDVSNPPSTTSYYQSSNPPPGVLKHRLSRVQAEYILKLAQGAGPRYPTLETTVGPSMLGSGSGSGRRGLGSSMKGDQNESVSLSRTATPPRRKKKESNAHANAFSALAALDEDEYPEPPSTVQPLTSATYIPSGESFGPGVGIPSLRTAKPYIASPLSAPDVDPASISLPESRSSMPYIVEKHQRSSPSRQTSSLDRPRAPKPEIIIEFGPKGKGTKYPSISVSTKAYKRSSLGSSSIESDRVESTRDISAHSSHTGNDKGVSFPENYTTRPTVAHGYHHRHISSRSSYVSVERTPSLYIVSDEGEKSITQPEATSNQRPEPTKSHPGRPIVPTSTAVPLRFRRHPVESGSSFASLPDSPLPIPPGLIEPSSREHLVPREYRPLYRLGRKGKAMEEDEEILPVLPKYDNEVDRVKSSAEPVIENDSARDEVDELLREWTTFF